jgi:hypothetical protein
MKQIFEQFLEFLQQGVRAIFRFVQLIWTWSADQIGKILQVPWESWPIWKQILLIVVVAAVSYFLFIAARRLWVAGVRVLTAFAGLLIAFVVTLPTVLIAGIIAVAGLWALNNFNFSLPPLTMLERDNTASPSPSNDEQSGQTIGQGAPRDGR